MILTLNVVAPSTADVRVLKYVVQVMPQVAGRVIEVPVEPNRLVKKGELLFRIDPTQYQNELERREGQARGRRGKARAGERERGRCLGRRARSCRSSSSPPAARCARCCRGSSSPGCACGRTASWWRPAPATASRWSRPRPTSSSSQAQIATATANEAQVTQKLSGQVNGEQASVAAARAQFATAKAQVDVEPRRRRERAMEPRPDGGLRADVTATRSTCSCGRARIVTALPVAPAMSFVEEDLPGHRAVSSRTSCGWSSPATRRSSRSRRIPGRMIKAKVDSIVWAQGQGQVVQSGVLPQTGAFPQVPGRFPVKFDGRRSATAICSSLPARPGDGAIYTEHVRGDPHHSQGDPARRRDHQLPDPEAALMRADRIDRRLGSSQSSSWPTCGLRTQAAAQPRRAAGATRCRNAAIPGGVEGGRAASRSRWPSAGWRRSTIPRCRPWSPRRWSTTPTCSVAAARVEQAAGYVQVASGAAAARGGPGGT